MLAEEVLVEDQLAVDRCGGGAQDGEDGVGEDGGFAEVFFLGGVFLCELLGGGGFDGLEGGLCVLDVVAIVMFVKQVYMCMVINVCQVLTTAGQMLVMAISLSPSRSKSMASPFVKTLMPTLPMA